MNINKRRLVTFIAASFFAASPVMSQDTNIETRSLQPAVERETRPIHEAFLAGTLAMSGFPELVDITPQPSETLSSDKISLIAATHMYDVLDLDGMSVALYSGQSIGHSYNADELNRRPYDAVLARDVGQVFGLAFDAQDDPNLYMTATSVYGLQIVAPDMNEDGVLDRVWEGVRGSEWMNGQWGGFEASGAGSIYKLVGSTGQVELFANVTLNGRSNTGAALGNIAFDAAHDQLFVSDLESGMIHRFDLNGNELEHFDHGVDARPVMDLQSVAFASETAVDIESAAFDPTDPGTWNLAVPERRVWGLAMNGRRLFYAVADGPQIWSIGIDEQTGEFADDPRWELTLSDDHPDLDVSDIVFTPDGAMVVAQRGGWVNQRDYSEMVTDTKAEVLRYVYETPRDDPETPSVWMEESPTVIPVGFQDTNRSGLGGVDLGPGYDERGRLDWRNCSGTLWTTGQNLRVNIDLVDALTPGGMLQVDGVQGVPRLYPVAENTPPWFSYFVDYDGEEPEAPRSGHIGDIEVLGCYGEGETQTSGAAGAGGLAQLPPQYNLPPEADLPDFWCAQGGLNAGVCLCALFPNSCFPSSPDPEPTSCAEVEAELACNPATGVYELTANITDISGAGLDQTKVEDPTSSITSLPITTPLPGPFTVDLTGLLPGQSGQLNICAFNAADQSTGDPFSCCNTTIPFQIPGEFCGEEPVQ